MLQGSCLCGGVRYEIRGGVGPSLHCHCVQCRKASGASFTTNASVAAEAFRFVEGESLLGQFESSPRPVSLLLHALRLSADQTDRGEARDVPASPRDARLRSRDDTGRSHFPPIQGPVDGHHG